MKSIETIRTAIENKKTRSAWSNGVKEYALELVEKLQETMRYCPEALDNDKLLRKALLNGAANWDQYSWGDCSLVYNDDIAKRLCTRSELYKTANGARRPNQSEDWLDVQARALY